VDFGELKKHSPRGGGAADRLWTAYRRKRNISRMIVIVVVVVVVVVVVMLGKGIIAQQQARICC